MASSTSQDNLLAVLNHYRLRGDLDAVFQAQCENWFDNLSRTDRLVVASVLEAFDYGREDEAEVLASYLPPAPGAIGARAGGANVLRATARVTFRGALAMALTAGIGAIVGTAV